MMFRPLGSCSEETAQPGAVRILGDNDRGAPSVRFGPSRRNG
jgi:hypothetical protein